MSRPVAAALPPFRPLPFLGNPHAQTVAGQYWPRRRVRLPVAKRFAVFPDGDQSVLHDSVPAGWTPATPCVVLIHGMGGSHQSGYVARLAQLLFAASRRVVRVDLRGCGDSLPLCKKFGHGGCSDDIRVILEHIAEFVPKAPLHLIGFSLGGNASLRFLAEAAARPLPRLERAAAVNPPIDMEACSLLLRERRNRIYERYFIKDLWRHAKERERHHPEVKAPPLDQLDTLRRFDELYTAPLSGFRDAADYYSFASSAPLLGRISVPTLLLTAADDPFIALAPFEKAKGTNPNLTVEIVPGGGHLGYLGKDGAGGIRWGDRRLLAWALGH